MKKQSFSSLALAGLLLAFAGLEFTGCKKGEEDPALSLRSRKARMTGNWTVQSFNDVSNFQGESSDSDQYRDEMEETTTTSFDGLNYNMSTVLAESGSSSNSSYTYDYEVTAEDGDYTEEWTYTSQDNWGNYTETVKYSGDYSATFDVTYVFNGDGTFSATMNQSMEYDASAIVEGTSYGQEMESMTSTTISGTWSFIGKNKNDDFGRGERVALWYNSYESDTEETYTSTVESSSSTDESSENTKYTGSDSDPDEVWELVMLKNKEMQVSRSYSYDVEMSYQNKYSSTWGSNDNYSSDYSGVQSGTSTMTLTRD